MRWGGGTEVANGPAVFQNHFPEASIQLLLTSHCLEVSHSPHRPPGMPGNTASIPHIQKKKSGGFITEEEGEKGRG